MKEPLAAVLALVLSVSAAGAVGSPESIKALGSSAFGTASTVQPKAFKASRYVRLSGRVSLRGSAWVFNENTQYVRVDVSGYTNISGDGGKIQSGSVRVSESVGVWVRPNQNYISEYVRVSEYVSFYKDGKYIGSANVTGNIHVSGWKTGNRISLDGSGQLDGSLFVTEEETPKKP